MLDFEYSKKVNFGFFEFGIYQFKSHQSSILVCALIIEEELWGLETKLYYFWWFQSQNIPKLGIFWNKTYFFGLQGLWNIMILKSQILSFKAIYQNVQASVKFWYQIQIIRYFIAAEISYYLMTVFYDRPVAAFYSNSYRI